MAQLGLAVDRMSEDQLYRRLQSELLACRLQIAARDRVHLVELRLRELERIVAELRHRGEQLPLVPQQPLGATEQAANDLRAAQPGNRLWRA